MLPFTIGNKHGRASVIVNELIKTGWKSRIFGYISIGDKVPDVMTTLWNRWKIGFIAIDESKQLKCKIGFATVGVLSSNGSTITVNPFVYVEINVAKCEICNFGEAISQYLSDTKIIWFTYNNEPTIIGHIGDFECSHQRCQTFSAKS